MEETGTDYLKLKDVSPEEGEQVTIATGEDHVPVLGAAAPVSSSTTGAQ